MIRALLNGLAWVAIWLIYWLIVGPIHLWGLYKYRARR